MAATATPVPTATPEATPTPAPTPTSEPTSTPLPTPTPTPACMSIVSDRVALAQLLLPLATPGEFSAYAELAATSQVGGVVVLGAPSHDQLTALPAQDGFGMRLLVASDEEGGRVQRLAGILGPLPAAATLTSGTPDDVRVQFADYGAGLAELGVDIAFAPVVDVGGGPGIGDRSLSDDPAVVAEYAEAIVAGYQDAGVIPVIKHFPGHGRASADSHLGFSTTPSLDELRTRDLLPYMALVDRVPVVMVGHLLVPGLTEDLPTSLSAEAITGLLRDELGFGGVVVTDALNMNAISNRWDNATAARLAIAAGADLVILESPASVGPVLDHLVASLQDGSLGRPAVEAALERVLALKGGDPCALVG